MDRGTWGVTVHKDAKSQTQLKGLRTQAPHHSGDLQSISHGLQFPHLENLNNDACPSSQSGQKK